MAIFEVRGPDGGIYEFEGPENATKEQILSAARRHFASAKPAEQPDTGFTGAFKSSLESLKGGLGALAGKTGLMDEAAAEQYAKEQEKKAKQVFKPTEEGWGEAPVTKFKELLGGSLPYMAAPIVAGGAATIAGAPGLVAAGLGTAASAAQFTGANLQRQMETGKTLAETELGAAAAAAIPQAALDTLSMRMIPGIGRIFGEAGVKITPEMAKKIAQQGVMDTVKAYGVQGLKTAGWEGLTETGQQFLERLQAGLNITDEEARKEYFESFLGGAILGGTLAVPGTFFERRQAVGEMQDKEAAEALKKRIETRQKQQALQSAQEATAEMAKLAPKKLPLTEAQQEAEAADIEAMRKEIFNQKRIIEQEIEPLKEQIVKAADDNEVVPPEVAQRYKQLKGMMDSLEPGALSSKLKDVQAEIKGLGTALTKAKNAKDTVAVQQLSSQIAANQEQATLIGRQLKALEPVKPNKVYEDIIEKIDALKKKRETFGGAVGDVDKILAIDEQIKALETQAKPGATTIEQGTLFGADETGVTSHAPMLGSREVLAKEISQGKVQAAKESKEAEKGIEQYVPLPPGQRPVYTVEPTGEKRAYTAEEQEYDQALYDFDTKKQEYETAVSETADKTLKDDKGRITEAGKRVQAALEAMQAAKDVILKRAAVEGEPAEIKNRELTEKEQDGLMLAITDTIDTMRKGEFKGGPNPAFARASLKQNAVEAITLLKRYAQNQVNLINNTRLANGLAPLNKPDEARIKGLIGDHIGQKISKATGWRAKEMKVTVETVMKNALEQAGLLTKAEGQVKTGFARKEFKDTKEFIKNLTAEYAEKPVKTRVKAGEKPSYAKQAQLKKLAAPIEKGIAEGKAAEAQAELVASRKEEKQAEEAAKGFDAFVAKESEIIKQSVSDLRKFVTKYKAGKEEGGAPVTAKEFAEAFNDSGLKKLLTKVGLLNSKAKQFLEKSIPKKHLAKLKNIQQQIDTKLDEINDHETKAKFWGELATRLEKDEWGTDTDTAKTYISKARDNAKKAEALRAEIKELRESLAYFEGMDKTHKTYVNKANKAFARADALSDEINTRYAMLAGNLIDRLKNADVSRLAAEMSPVLVKARKDANAARAAERAKAAAEMGVQRALARLKEQAAEAVDIMARKAAILEEQRRAERITGEIKVKTKEGKEEVLPGVRVQATENVPSQYALSRPVSWMSKSVQTLINWANHSHFAWQERQANKSLTMNKRQQAAYEAVGEQAESDFKKLKDKLQALGLYEPIDYKLEGYDPSVHGPLSIGKLVELQAKTEQNTKKYRDYERGLRILSEFQQQKVYQRAGGTPDLNKPKPRKLEKQPIRSLQERYDSMMAMARAAQINKALPDEYYAFDEKELTDTIAELKELFADALASDAKGEKLSTKEYEQVQLVKALETRLNSDADVRTDVHELSAKRTALQEEFDANMKRLANPKTSQTARRDISIRNEQIEREVKDLTGLISATTVLKVRGKAQEPIGFRKFKPTKSYTRYARSLLGQTAGVSPEFYSEVIVKKAADSALTAQGDANKLMGALELYGALLDNPAVSQERKDRYQVQYDYAFNRLQHMLERNKKADWKGVFSSLVKEYDVQKDQRDSEIANEAKQAGMSVEEYKRIFDVSDDIDWRSGTKGAGVPDAEVKSLIDGLKIPEGVKVKLMSTLPASIRAAAARQGLTQAQIDGIKGGVLPDGTVFVVADTHSDITDVKKTLAHEITGHIGVTNLLGEDGLKSLAKRAVKSEGGLLGLADNMGVGDEARAAYTAAKNAGKSEEEANLVAMKELIAHAEEGRVTRSAMAKVSEFIKAMVGMVRAALRKMGIDLDVNTTDLYNILRQARKTYTQVTPGIHFTGDGDILFNRGRTKFTTEGAPFASDDELIATQKSMGDRIRGFATGLWFRTQFVDRYAATLAALKKGVAEGRMDDLQAMQIEYYLRMYDQRNYFVAEIASHGPITLKEVTRADGKTEYVIETGDAEGNKGLKAIAEALNKSGMGNPEAVREAFSKYMIAERAKQVGLKKLNLEGIYSQAQIDAWVDAGRKNAAFQEARDLYREYNRGLLDFARKTGAISDARFKFLTTNPITGSSDFDYVPFYRRMGNDIVLDLGEGDYVNMGNMKNQPDLKRLVGGDAPILDFYTSAVQNTTMITDMGLRNLATRAAGNALMDLGYAKKVGKGKMGPNIIRAKEAGNDVAYEIESDDLGIPTDLIVQGLEGVAATLPLYVRILSIPANVLRRFVTLNPVYALRQMMRDPLAATMLSGADMIPVIDSVKEITKMITGKSQGERLLQGKGLVGGQVLTGNSEDMQTILNQIVGGKAGWQRGMAFLESLAIQGDASTRVVMYNSFRKQGLSDMEASLATLESMNFSKRGVSPTLFHLNKMIPFLNAQIQGLDVLYRALSGKMVKSDALKVRKKLVQRATMMAAFTVAYALAMQDDEGYQNATEEERLGNWFVKLPGLEESVKVPIPFEIGFLFKALPEAIVNMAMGNTETKRALDGLGRLGMMAVPGGGVPIPVGLKPLVEMTLNKSFFTGREIVGADLMNLDPQMRYRDNTTEFAKMLGYMGVSPVAVDYLIRGYTGGLGVAITSLANPVLRPSAEGKIPQPAGKGLISSTTPFVGGLFQPKDAPGLINAAYDTLEDAARAEKTFNAMIEKGRTAEAKQYLLDNMKRIEVGEMYYELKYQMADLTSAEKAVKSSPTMTPERKRQMLDDLRQQKIRLSKYLLQASGS